MKQQAAIVDQAVAVIRRSYAGSPRTGIILGTGLGPLAAQVSEPVSFPFTELPGFPHATAPGHVGKLLCGELAAAPVCVMQGRPHLYEGHPAHCAALPVRIMRALGIERLIVTCASGGLNPRFRTGDVVVLEDHINFMFANPLIGPEDARLGPRFPDMSCPYDRQLAERALALAREFNCRAHRGAYAAMSGPNYETRAEYRMLRRLGADCVGMSTVPEVLAAVQMGLPVLGLSVVTNVFCDGLRENGHHPTTADEVIYDVTLAAPAVEYILRGVLQGTANEPV